MAGTPTVFVVDDDSQIRRSLVRLVESIGLPAEGFATAEEFLDTFDPERPGCVLADVRMPGLSGLDLLDALTERGSSLPVIILTGHGEVPSAVRAMKEGAFDFIEKPFSPQIVVDRLHEALSVNETRRREAEERGDVRRKLGKLTPRERQVLDLVVAGKPNRVVAVELGISDKTVEFHRSRIMTKLGAGSLAELVRLVLRAGSNADDGPR